MLHGLFGRDSIYAGLWVLQLAMAAVFTPVTTRLLGPARFGLVVSSVAVMQVLTAAGSVPVQTAIQRRYAASGGTRDARRLMVFASIVSFVIFAVADLSGPLWAPAVGLGPYPLAVRYAVLWACLTSITFAGLGLLRCRDQLIPFAAVAFLQSVVAEGLSMLLVLLVARTAAAWILGELLAQVAALCVALAFAPPLPLRWRDRRIVASALRYAVPLVPASLSVFVLNSSDRLVVQHYLGPTAVARYAVAYNIGASLIILLNVLNMVWMPRVFALSDPQVREGLIAQSRDALFALLIPMLIGLQFGAPLLLRVWAPPRYRPDSLPLVVAFVGASSIAFAAATSQVRVLLANGRTRSVASATILAAFTNLGLNIVLVPLMGINGSALATLLGFTSQYLLLGRSSRDARLRSTHRGLRLGLAAAVGLGFAAVWIPVSGPFLVFRAAVASGSAAISAGMMWTLAGHTVPGSLRGFTAWATSPVGAGSL